MYINGKAITKLETLMRERERMRERELIAFGSGRECVWGIIKRREREREGGMREWW